MSKAEATSKGPAPIRRALISVSDRTGVVELAGKLESLGVTIVSTGGTGEALKSAGVKVTDVADVTKFPEMMDGRVKTLHPAVHGGLLQVRANETHVAAAREHGIEPIDLLIVNLYPFEDALAAKASEDELIAKIDIGGPAMIRSAAKNHGDVTVVVDPADYAALAEELNRNQGATTFEFRRRLAAKAFSRTAAYDAAISTWMVGVAGETTPDYRVLGGKLIAALRYGENPHQTAGFYRSTEDRPGVAMASVAERGKGLSYNNVLDADAAFECVSEFDPAASAAVAIIKHANPAGVAVAASLKEAYAKALRCDPVSAFGGIVAVNRALDRETAEEIARLFTEVVVAPAIDDAAHEVLAAKKNLRVLVTGGRLADPKVGGLVIRAVAGGFLAQSRDNSVLDRSRLKVVTRRKPTDEELEDLVFGYTVAKHVKSNAIVFAKDGATVGIGAGQMSRVDSVEIAILKSAAASMVAKLGQPMTVGSVVASDAFFPFPDALEGAAKAGATAAIQPGGSMRDEAVIAAADAAGMAMVFTGERHFRH